MRRIIRAGHACHGHSDIEHSEGGGNRIDGSEQKLGLHHGKGHIEQLLKFVLHAVDGRRLIIGLGDVLETRQKYQKSSTHAHPQGDEHNHPHDIIGVGVPQNRLVDQTHIQQDIVQISHTVAGKDHHPHGRHCDTAADRGRVERQCKRPFELQLIDDPCGKEGKQIPHRPCDNCELQRVGKTDHKNFVVQKQQPIVGQPHKLRRLHHIIVGEAQADCRYHGSYNEYGEQNDEGSQKCISHPVLTPKAFDCF